MVNTSTDFLKNYAFKKLLFSLVVLTKVKILLRSQLRSQNTSNCPLDELILINRSDKFSGLCGNG